MITEATVNAPQGLTTGHWHSIDGSKATRQTRKLQMRIAKAVKSQLTAGSHQ